LKKLFLLDKQKWSPQTIMHVGLQLIDVLESTHRAGYVFNDLKLDNILIQYGTLPDRGRHNIFYGIKLHLIDFGFATEFRENGQHIEQRKL
jgi:serine/threonine protein kinase